MISLADLLLPPHLSMFALAPEGAQILREHENLSGWLARIEARPSMVAITWDRLLERVAARRLRRRQSRALRPAEDGISVIESYVIDCIRNRVGQWAPRSTECPTSSCKI